MVLLLDMYCVLFPFFLGLLEYLVMMAPVCVVVIVLAEVATPIDLLIVLWPCWRIPSIYLLLHSYSQAGVGIGGVVVLPFGIDWLPFIVIYC